MSVGSSDPQRIKIVPMSARFDCWMMWIPWPCRRKCTKLIVLVDASVEQNSYIIYFSHIIKPEGFAVNQIFHDRFPNNSIKD